MFPTRKAPIAPQLRKVVGEGELEALQSRLAGLRDSHEAAQEELEMLRQQLHVGRGGV